MGDISNNQKNTVGIEDILTGNDLIVNADGSIKVNQSIAPPLTSTPIDINEFDSVSSTVGVDTYYVITNSKVLTIQGMSGGAELHTSGSIVELFYDPDADLGVNLERVETVFVNGNSESATVQRDFIGDGTKRIVLRRRRYAANAKEMWGRWRGFEL